MNAQADNRGLETSISGLFLRIIVYEYLYDSIYCLANSFLTKKGFCSESDADKTQVLYRPTLATRYTVDRKVLFSKEMKGRFV